MNDEPLAKSTMQNYKGTLKKLQEFCQEKKYVYDELSEQAILHFIADLNKKGVSFSVMAQVKPVIILLLQMQTGGAVNFTARADRWCEAA
jgi:site-specific recombinase XerD